MHQVFYSALNPYQIFTEQNFCLLFFVQTYKLLFINQEHILQKLIL